jgi:hypothetical protein
MKMCTIIIVRTDPEAYPMQDLGIRNHRREPIIMTSGHFLFIE